MASSIRELSAEELAAVGGGDTWTCTVTTNAQGKATHVVCVNNQTGQRTDTTYYNGYQPK